TMEYEAIEEGTLAKIVIPEGTQDVPVNQLIAVLAEEGEDVKTAAATAAKRAPARADLTATGNSPSAASAKQTISPVPAPQKSAAPQAVPASSGSAAGNGHADSRARPGNRIFASPLARRLAKEAAIELTRIAGSGPHGRIIARDVEAAKVGKGLSAPSPAPAAPLPAMAALSDDKVRALFEPGSYDVVPHDSMRKIIARRLTEAKTSIPHFYLTLDCRIGALLSAREEINAAAAKDKEGRPL